ncbi:uncharacterized protein LOC111638795 [Centruroides sculpturatus]|uniref:uncharacterized protein LOC111638795 n=1 Tax=Centruroides sculpturatus TaxID=218467 RepID=UPI000C6EDD5E|nr:uncharacterized protein LOC111638795 [Centruroides sculpturatus]
MMEYKASLSSIYRQIGAATKKSIIYKRNPTIYQLLRADKDAVDKNALSGVYSIPATDTQRQNMMFYIGVTGKSLKEKLSEHQRNIRSRQPCTALATYVLADPQEVKAEWDRARLIQIVRDKKHLRYAEAWHIYKTSQKGLAINFRDASKDGRLRSGDHILQIGDVNLRRMGSEEVATVLRQSGSHVRIIVARPVDPTSPDYNALHSNAPIVPTRILADPEEVERHLTMFQQAHNGFGENVPDYIRSSDLSHINHIKDNVREEAFRQYEYFGNRLHSCGLTYQNSHSTST